MAVTTEGGLAWPDDWIGRGFCTQRNLGSMARYEITNRLFPRSSQTFHQASLGCEKGAKEHPRGSGCAVRDRHAGGAWAGNFDDHHRNRTHRFPG